MKANLTAATIAAIGTFFLALMIWSSLGPAIANLPR
jgi:hypothetical protein